MKTRIIGTRSSTHVNKFLALIKQERDYFTYRENERKILILNGNKKELMVFSQNRSTFRQTIEVWEAFGLITNVHGKYLINFKGNSEEIYTYIKYNLLQISNDSQIQFTRNSKLLLIEHASNPLSNKEIKLWKIVQKKGELHKDKLTKEISSIEKLFAKDKIFIARIRSVLYAKIIEEL